MATFTNFATLSYNGGTTTSNIVTGQLLETLAVSKIAVMDDYTARDDVTYVVTLRNTGDKPFEMEEYGHNFISLGDEAVDENYKLEVPALKDTAGLTNGVLYPVPGGFELEGEPSFSFYVKSSDTVKGEPAWRMTHKTLGWNCCEYTSFDPCRVAIWGDYYVLSCEVFLPIKLAPGEEMTWSRTWEFNV